VEDNQFAFWKGKRMNRRLTALALFCVAALFCASCLAITDEEIQKIQNAAPTAPVAAPAKARKLLVFNRCKGWVHPCIPYWDKALEIMGQKTGAFQTVVSDDMSVFSPENLKAFDAVCFNNTTRLDFDRPELRNSLLDFVKNGGGIVGIHAATDNFYDWPEAAQMMGGIFDSHPWGAGGTWAVKIDDPQHPLTAAFAGKAFKVNDEIYLIKQIGLRDNCRILLSLDLTDQATTNAATAVKDNPISWVRTYGKGRVFYCALGHNHHITWDPAILKHYLAGIQFALGDLPVDASPAPSPSRKLESLLETIRSYEYGQSRLALTELSDLVKSAHGSPETLAQIEKSFVQFLKSDATLAAKQYICRELSIVGTEQSVPALAAMLPDAATSDIARYALERIPGPAVDEALGKALSKAAGKEKIGIINTLAVRRDRKSVTVLKNLVYDPDPQLAAAAIAALGRIAGPEATELLAQAMQKTKGSLQQLALDAYLQCADELAATGQGKKAFAIYHQVYSGTAPAVIRIAALRGMVMSAPDQSVGIVLEALKAEDPLICAAAVGLVRELPAGQDITPITRQLPRLIPERQALLLSALADTSDAKALPAVTSAAESPDEQVRIAALEAIGKLGGAADVTLLARKAATAKDQEQLAARSSLYQLKGITVDSTILDLMSGAEPDVKVELIRSIAERNISNAVPVLLEAATAPQATVRLESIKALRTIAEPKHLPDIVKLLVNTRSEEDQAEAEKTVVTVARKIPDRNNRAGELLAVLPSVSDAATKRVVLSALGKTEDDSALPALRAAVAETDSTLQQTAIRALSDWPTAEPAGDLLNAAQSPDKPETTRVLALRGFIRLTGLESGRSAEKTVEMYKTAMGLATAANEKKLVLSGLANVKSPLALEMAAEYLADAVVGSEAAAAVIKIGETIGKDYPEQTRLVLQKLLAGSPNESLRGQAQKILEQIQ
jgi:type 1 glutamine amidotransferase/HEAT repeat protein